MLQRFSVKNFRGFESRIEIDFTRHANYEFHDGVVKDGTLKNGIFFGPNGCGKSNLSMAIFDIVNHLTEKVKRLDYYTNFANASHLQSPVEFDYRFALDGNLIDYRYQKDDHGALLGETLIVNQEEIFSWTKDGLRIVSAEFQMTDEARKNLSNNANRVSVIRFLSSVFPLKEDHYLLRLLAFVNSMLWYQCLDTRTFIGLENTNTKIFEYMIQHHHVEAFQRFLQEVSGQKFTFKTGKINNRDELFCAYGGNLLSFSLVSSTGTNALSLLFYWLLKMKNASFVFIDEFDAFYHFALAKKVCEALFQQDCQVFLSSHNTYLMTNDLLRPDCKFLFTDDHTVKPLNECTEKELRFGHNIEKMYRGGAFQS